MPDFGYYFNASLGFFRHISAGVGDGGESGDAGQPPDHPAQPNTSLSVIDNIKNNVTANTSAFPWQQSSEDLLNQSSYLTTTEYLINYNQTLLSNSTNASEHGGLPLPLEDKYQALLILFYSLAALLAISGNTLVIVVFAIGRRSRSDLRIYLINLALADLFMAVFCIPFTFTQQMLQSWIFSGPMCPIVLFMQTTMVTVSVSTNMAIGFDRFWAVTYPLKSRLTGSRVKIVIGTIWVIAVSLGAPNLAVGEATQSGGNLTFCQEVWPDTENGTDSSHSHSRIVYGTFILCLTYIIPLTILLVTYSLVGRKLWQRTTPGNRDRARDAAQLQSKRKVIKMLVTIVALFGICWLPLHLFIQILEFKPELIHPDNTETLNILYYCFHWLAMSNSFQNPIIYGFLNDSFQSDLYDLILRVFPCCKVCPCCKNRRALGYANTLQASKYSNIYRPQGRKASQASLSLADSATKDTSIRAKKKNSSVSSTSSNKSSHEEKKMNGNAHTHIDIETGEPENEKLLPQNGKTGHKDAVSAV